jgi:hypothetical protein
LYWSMWPWGFHRPTSFASLQPKIHCGRNSRTTRTRDQRGSQSGRNWGESGAKLTAKLIRFYVRRVPTLRPI